MAWKDRLKEIMAMRVIVTKTDNMTRRVSLRAKVLYCFLMF